MCATKERRRQLVCRVKFDTQSAAAGEDITLVRAAKAFFENSKPSFWNLFAFIAPRPFLPVLRVLAKAFPTQANIGREFAVANMYGASDCLIQVIL